MNPQPAPGPASTFELSSAGQAELKRGVTDLSSVELQVLVRCDGATPAQAMRAAMQAVPDLDFWNALGTLERKRLVQPVAHDPMALQLQEQLQMLGPKASGSARGGSFAVGLALRRPARVAGFQPGVAVVVEDEPTLAQFVKAFLALEGFEVRLAANRAEVQAAVKQGVPEVMLLDGTLPDVDGVDVLRSIRQHAHPALREVPVLMMTARATREAVLRALEHGADGYLTKPVDADALTTAVRAVTGRLPA